MPVTINTPPKAEPERLSRLVERVNAGEIKIPKFQRGFVWEKLDVLELLESILQGYPIGSLLFWRTEQKLKRERDIHGFALPSTPDKYPTNYVLGAFPKSRYYAANGKDGANAILVNKFQRLAL